MRGVTDGRPAMPTKMFIYGESSLPSLRPRASSLDLIRDLNDFLQDRGEVIGDHDDNCGPQWNVGVLLHTDPEDVDGWIERLTDFLRKWGVRDSVLSFTIVRGDTNPVWEKRRVQ
jgi:hypothetical protein